ncbi:MAG: ROK family protein, partial [Caldilineaceae bacterium]|nr:ROK family protein [Caldilineaceae bacterium]
QLKVTRDGTNYVVLEALVSGPGLIQAYNERVQPHAQVAQGQEIAIRAKQGDPVAQQTISELGKWLGLGLSHALHSYDAACVVVGGSVAQLGAPLFESACQSLQIHGHSTVALTPLLPAALGPKAGLFGAALFAQQQEKDGNDG